MILWWLGMIALAFVASIGLLAAIAIIWEFIQVVLIWSQIR